MAETTSQTSRKHRLTDVRLNEMDAACQLCQFGPCLSQHTCRQVVAHYLALWQAFKQLARQVARPGTKLTDGCRDGVRQN